VHGQAGIDTKTLDTTVSVHPHEVLVLGGLFEQGDQRSKACLPWLGKLPGVGPLFCHHHRQTRKQALWVLIQVDVLPVSALVNVDHKSDKAS
jgi:type II secretory pathway component GspD/PulD (secretin)